MIGILSSSHRMYLLAFLTVCILSTVLFFLKNPRHVCELSLIEHPLQQIQDNIKIRSKPVQPTLRRLLWWSNVYGAAPQFFGAGNSPNVLQSMARACKSPCVFVTDRKLLNVSHAVLFHGWSQDLPVRKVQKENVSVLVPDDVPFPRDPEQMYVYVTYESFARIRKNMEAYRDFFNWTMTYSSNSELMLKYGRVIPKSKAEMERSEDLTTLAVLAKEHLVAWTVTNCDDAPSGRNQLVEELQKHISVNIYGKCGNLSCKAEGRSECYKEVGATHKFYLSFENSLCQDYVSEKFFHAMEARMVPVVYGKANYGFRFPPGSFINVDSFPSAKALAHYLCWLDENEKEYLKYFEWRKTMRVDSNWLVTHHYCDACEKVHEDYGVKRSVVDINEWLRRDSHNDPVCTAPQRFV